MEMNIIQPSTKHDPIIKDYFELLKPRVMALAIFTAAVGMVVAKTPVHPVIVLASLLCIACGAGACGALNMWWDSDIDAHMERTRNRPIPSQRISREQSLVLGVILGIFSVSFLSIFANILAASLLLATILFYTIVYTMLLKRTTHHNIVIGGVSGALPPMVGWAVATNSISYESVLLFMIIFSWTPAHFWALALFHTMDYSKAGVPMLTVTAGDRSTRNQIAIYTALLVILSKKDRVLNSEIIFFHI
jgi:protoheme IX farnesyltransferase